MNERRRYCRVSGDMVRDIAVRVRGGGDGTLLNFGREGGLIAVQRPMPPGSRVDVQLSAANARITVRALVLRCRVRTIAALEGVTYEAALQFDEHIELPRVDHARSGYPLPAETGANSVTGGSALPTLSNRPRSLDRELAK